MPVVVVESPAKAKTINKYLGSDYHVLASFGHVRDLPPKDGSVDPDDDFAMLWEIDGKASKHVSEIAKAVKGSDGLILATDPDREGEAISWHILEAMKDKKVLKGVPVSRVTFNAITKQAIDAAMKAPREIDQALVDAYLARRALDYLVGFNLSPVLWRKLPGARSAGRVQSVALRLVCDREREIELFKTREYWSVLANLKTPRQDAFEARLTGVDGRKITRLDIGSGAEAESFKQALLNATFTVEAIEAKPARRNPYPPFTTSTLQQEASRKLGFAPAITMRLAQRLYEGVDLGGETVGLITYMRTDGVQMAPEAIAGVRRYIEKDFAAGYLPKVPRAYSTKAKNAQEAHEAIRPTDAFRTPKSLARVLEGDALRLYELIWKRTIASQMESAVFERTSVDILATLPQKTAGHSKLELKASGQVVTFDGFLTLYTESTDDEEDEDNRRLPQMKAGESLSRESIVATQHFTEPPPRYSEASLVKRMEELGIGRPSTYASTLGTLRDREYVRLEKKRLVPEDKGRIVTGFLSSFFSRYVEYDFTAALENDLDRVSNSEIEFKQVLRDFWKDFSAAIAGTKELRTTQVLDALNELLSDAIFPDKGDNTDPRQCPRCAAGKLSLKLGKLGPFVGCSNYPECRFTRPLAATGVDGEQVQGEDGASGIIKLGLDPETELEITIRDGRFGPYVQLGEGDKPKRQSLPKGLKPADTTLEKAIQLLSLPRTIGNHPESGTPILASIGRYGPYIQHGTMYVNLESFEDALTIGLNRAVDMIATKEAGGGKTRFGRAATPAGKVMGDHPDGGAITLRDGRFGAYVAWNKINATIPRAMDKDTLTLEQAIGLIRAKEANGPAPKKAAPKKAAAKKADASEAPAKTAAKKPAAKKAPAKKPAAKAKVAE